MRFSCFNIVLATQHSNLKHLRVANIPDIPASAIRSSMAPARLVPSFGEVPLPISSTKTRDRLPQVRNKDATSPISAPKALLFSVGMSALAPRTKIASNRRMDDPVITGAQRPDEINKAAAAVLLITVDLLRDNHP
jgi:hypothetical protein